MGEILAGLLLLAGVLFVFRGTRKGLIFFENDTLVYYYPVLAEVSRALRQGILPLWTPYIYSGFPLFADGEAGALYPLNLLLLLLTSPEGTLLWLGPLRVAMAAFFMYLYARTIGLGSLGSVVSALVFAFGAFTIAQLHHLNLSSGALWLPLVLFFVERAYRREGRGRAWAVALAGVAFGIQSLALHVQVSLMTIFLLVIYICFRTWAFPLGSFLQRVRLMVGTLAGTVGLGLGLAAVQWLPLYELSRFSPRAPGLLYSKALEYALPPPNLITLLSPYFFRGPQRVSWAIWSSWETAIYVGIAPLLLAAVAVLWVRSRWTVFFAGSGILSLTLAMANYLPLNLHYLVYRLPWFDALRAPGRFSYLFTFSLACLAGLGARWLSTHREGPLPRSFPALALSFLGLMSALLLAFQWLGRWLQANRDSAVDLLGQVYLRLGTPQVPHLNQWDVYDFLRESVELRNWTGPAGLSLAACALLLAWAWLPRWRRACMLGLALLVAGDLFWFAYDFHETIPVAKLAQAGPAVDFLAHNLEGERAFSMRTALDPNLLAPLGLQAAGGYGSLPFQRHSRYSAAAWNAMESRLLDVWNVRFLIMPRRFPGPSYRGLSFDVGMPLFNSARQGPSPRLQFAVPEVQAQELRVVSVLRQGAHLLQGTPVGAILLTDKQGFKQRLPLLAGVHTAEAAYDRADVRPVVRHEKPAVADIVPGTDPAGNVYQSYVYFASVPLAQSATVQSVSFEYDLNSGGLEVYGVGLVRDGVQVYEVRPYHTAKYRPAYHDGNVTIYEARGTLPRAFLAPGAVSLANDLAVLERLASPDLDPLAEVLLEEPLREESRAEGRESGTIPRSPGTATIREYGDQRVTVDTEAEQLSFLFLGDSYYPGWRAYVDGQEARIYRADYLFRAVPVPAGRHVVEFRYQPDSFAQGIWVSGASAGLLALGLLWSSLGFRPFRSS